MAFADPRGYPTTSAVPCLCPSCGTIDYVRKVSAIVAEQSASSSFQGTSVGSATVWGQAGHATGTSSSYVRGSGNSQTALVQRLAPPSEPEFSSKASSDLASGGCVLVVIGTLLGIWAWSSFEANHHIRLGILVKVAPAIIALLIGITCLSGVSNEKERERDRFKNAIDYWRKRMAAWDREFYCGRCDSVFECVSPSAPGQTSHTTTQSSGPRIEAYGPTPAAVFPDPRVAPVNMSSRQELRVSRVICDFCSEDYSQSLDTGGLFFQSNAVCPKCAPTARNRAREYGEEELIRAECPTNVAFRDWVVEMRFRHMPRPISDSFRSNFPADADVNSEMIQIVAGPFSVYPPMANAAERTATDALRLAMRDLRSAIDGWALYRRALATTDDERAARTLYLRDPLICDVVARHVASEGIGFLPGPAVTIPSWEGSARATISYLSPEYRNIKLEASSEPIA